MYSLTMMQVKWLIRIIGQFLKALFCIWGGGWARQYTREGLTVYEDGLKVYKCEEGQYIRGNRQFIRGTDIIYGGEDRQYMRRGQTVYKGGRTLYNNFFFYYLVLIHYFSNDSYKVHNHGHAYDKQG